MNYKYISGEILPLPEDTRWSDGMKLQDIYPNSSFVSGTENPEGMKIHPVVKNNMVQINYTFEERFAGGPGLVHGGILAAAIDDLMGYATVIHNHMCVTANLSVNYISPVPVGEEFELLAWVTKIDGKKVSTESIIKSGDKIHVESSALFLEILDNVEEIFKVDKNYP